MALGTEFNELNYLNIRLYEYNIDEVTKTLKATRSVPVSCGVDKNPDPECKGASVIFFLEEDRRVNECMYFDLNCRKVASVTPTPTPTSTNTPSVTNTSTSTQTPTTSVTPTQTPTQTTTNTQTPTETITPTVTSTNTVTPSLTPSNTATATPTSTYTSTPTPTATPMNPCSKRKYLNVKVATTEFLQYANLSGSYRRGSMIGFNTRLVIDGVTLSDGDLVLVKNNYDKKDDAGATIWSGSDLYQVDFAGNSVRPWQLNSYSAGLATWCSTFNEIIQVGETTQTTSFCPIFIQQGDINGSTEWLLPANFDVLEPSRSSIKCQDEIIVRQVRLATTESISLSGHQTIDGFVTVDNDRILVKNQTNKVENGIYVAFGSNWIRSAGARDNLNLITSFTIIVTQGKVNKGTWVLK